MLLCNTLAVLQAHPDKQLARELHAARPEVYRDGNHKPEMAVALTDFECLCGFRAPIDIAAQLQQYPEMLPLLGCQGERAWWYVSATRA